MATLANPISGNENPPFSKKTWLKDDLDNTYGILTTILSCVLQIAYNAASAQNSPVGVADGTVGPQPRCLTGYMTDVQSWVDETGSLTSAVELHNTIDLSAMQDVIPMLYQQIQFFRADTSRSVKFLSMARCQLNRVPTVFQLTDTRGRTLSETVEYITLYGNQFLDISVPGVQYDMFMNASKAREIDADFGFKRPATSAWSSGLHQVVFSHLRQLDLRKCNIQILSDSLFRGMPKLEALYLGENSITLISGNAFFGLGKLLHLDISRNLEGNENEILTFESLDVLRDLTKLISLDLSFTKIQRRDVDVFKSFGKHFQRLSLCHSGIPRLGDFIFNGTSLRFIDVSYNNGILTGHNVLGGTEKTLQVVYADEIGLKTFDIFYKFDKLEILRLIGNELGLITKKTTQTLTNLQVLDLNNNRITTWFASVYSSMPKLQFLSIRDNNINLISEDMMNDIQNISYIGLSGNFIVCNCHTRELFELALRNENKSSHRLIKSRDQSENENFSFHTGFEDFNRIITDRKRVTRICSERYPCAEEEEVLESQGDFLLIDFDSAIYQCLNVAEGTSVAFSNVQTCQNSRIDGGIQDVIDEGWNRLLALIAIPAILFPLLILCYVFRRRFKYFLITLKNSATLSLMNRNDVIEDSTIFNYDVFVSYCNEDRDWVLDHLLPHVEKDCNVCVCLHERDFMVGLSILENIVSCMDRSRSIMLIISKKFLLSQWCQFEMHLAQHRLLETRREDLILILLEELAPPAPNYPPLPDADQDLHSVAEGRLQPTLVLETVEEEFDHSSFGSTRKYFAGLKL